MFVALGIQHAKRMRIVARLAVQSFPILFHKRHCLRKNYVEHKMCTIIFYKTLSETFLILRRIQLYMTKNLNWSSCKVAVILVRF